MESLYDNSAANKIADELGATVIVAESTSAVHYLQDFHGFTLARDLRRKERYLGPIILVSCLPKEFFLERVEQYHEFRILQGRGTGFLDLHDINDEEKVKAVVEAIRPLSEVGLLDLCSNLLEEHGYLRSKLDHDLKLHSPAEKRSAILREVLDILGTRGQAVLPVGREQVLAAEQPDELAFAEAKSMALVALAALYRSGENEDLPQEGASGRLLLLEDDAEDRQLIEQRLQHHFILEWAESGEDLISRLKADAAYAYDVVLCDWRLKDAQGNWLDMQGYDVLDEAARFHPAALFALTSMDDRSVHAMRNQLNARIQLMKKDHFREQSDPLVEMLRTAIADKQDLCASFPSGTDWDTIYRDQYIALRNSRAWPSLEQEIGDAAWQLCDAAIDALTEQDNDRKRWEQFGLEGLRYDELDLKLGKKGLKDFLVMRRYVLGLFFATAQRPIPFSEDLPLVHEHKGKQDKAGIDRLNRMAWLTWLLYKIPYQGEEDEFGAAFLEAIKKKMKNALTNSLALPATSLPKGCVLLEERRWLESHGIRLDMQFT